MNNETTIINDLYDLIKGSCLRDDIIPDKNGEWEQLSKAHFLEAKENMGNFVRDKYISVDTERAKITITGDKYEYEILIYRKDKNE